jgi:hypothetical protein
MITSSRTAYKIGFSDALDHLSWSGYKDILKWNFEKRVHRRAYYRGWSDGWRIKCEVKKEFVSTLVVQRSGTCGDGTVERENTI